MAKQTVPTDESIWQTALTILAEAPEENEYLELRTLATMTAESYSLVGEHAPKAGRVAHLLRVALSHFQKQHSDLLLRKSPRRAQRHFEPGEKAPMGGWFTLYRWAGPNLTDWPEGGYVMPIKPICEVNHG